MAGTRAPSPPAPPDAVAFPTTTEEVAAVVRTCAAHRVPVIPFGAGSSVEGHVLAAHGGVAVDLTGMSELLELSPDDLDCRVQAGLTWRDLNRRLRHSGLFFPVDPGADATLGGMTATGASGTNAVRYGTMRDNVLGLTVVLADGEVVRTGTRARKSSAGYDLTRLLVGSEGTLAVITEVALRLVGVPEVVTAAVCQFDGLQGATRTVIETIQLGVPVARIELLDDIGMGGVIAYSGLDELAAAPTLFLEFHGTAGGVAEQAAQVAQIAAGHAGDGNFHLLILVDPDDPAEVARGEAVHDRMVRRAVAMGGTCTGEHGIGLGKVAHLEHEHPDGVRVMRRVKDALDPLGILNPGKVLRPA